MPERRRRRRRTGRRRRRRRRRDPVCEPPPFINVHFQHGYSKDEITDESELQLNVEDDEKSSQEVLGDLASLAERLKEHTGYRYEVQGHADRSGDATKNMDLSRRRGQSVINYLSAQGGPASQLDLIWYGESAPTDPNTPDGEMKDEDRRAEMHVISPMKCSCGRYTCPGNPNRPAPGGAQAAPPPPAGQEPGQDDGQSPNQDQPNNEAPAQDPGQQDPGQQDPGQQDPSQEAPADEAPAEEDKPEENKPEEEDPDNLPPSPWEGAVVSG
ncbi:MAG: OmpA family protein, partial [Planctomycetota bacterium]